MAIGETQIYWEQLQRMEPAALEQFFETHKAKNLFWALDQAMCLAYNTDKKTGHATLAAIGNFATGLMHETEITADELCGGHACILAAHCSPEGSPNRAHAVKQFPLWLANVAKTSRTAALEKAALTLSHLLAPEPLREAAANYLLENTSASNMKYLPLLFKTATPARIEKLLNRFDAHARKAPYVTLQAMATITDRTPDCMTYAQLERAENIRTRCIKDPRTISDGLAKLGIGLGNAAHILH